MTEQIGQWILIGIMVAFIAFDKAKKLFSNNPKGFGERIASLETDMKNVKEDIKEINRKLNRNS